MHDVLLTSQGTKESCSRSNRSDDVMEGTNVLYTCANIYVLLNSCLESLRRPCTSIVHYYQFKCFYLADFEQAVGLYLSKTSSPYPKSAPRVMGL